MCLRRQKAVLHACLSAACLKLRHSRWRRLGIPWHSSQNDHSGYQGCRTAYLEGANALWKGDWAIEGLPPSKCHPVLGSQYSPRQDLPSHGVLPRGWPIQSHQQRYFWTISVAKKVMSSKRSSNQILKTGYLVLLLKVSRGQIEYFQVPSQSPAAASLGIPCWYTLVWFLLDVTRNYVMQLWMMYFITITTGVEALPWTSPGG